MGGGLTPKAVPKLNGEKKSVSARQIELFQVYDNYISADSSEQRLSAGEEMLKVLAEQMEVEKAYENFLAIVYDNQTDRDGARQGKSLPDNMDCEMAAHTAFAEHGKFD